MDSDIDLDTVDIIVNRNSLRNLLNFVSGRSHSPFCMGLDMVQNTIFSTRKEKEAHQMIHPRGNSGCGHNFEETFTTPQEGLGNSSSHHRVIRYRLEHFDCHVRFEVDTYYDEGDGEGSDAPAVSPKDDVITGVAKPAVDEQEPNKQTKGCGQTINRASEL